MTERHQSPSVADMMLKDRSLAETHLIKPAWSLQSVLRPKYEGRSGSN